MLGPYTARDDGAISYKGNKIFPSMEDVRGHTLSVSELEQRVNSIHDDKHWNSIARINNQVNKSVSEYFGDLGALFVPLPLTTRMISSPGAVYGKEAIDYTTDTSPIRLNWFDLPSEAFLAESSQIYLELALLQSEVSQVWANYHSFRKEPADATHLSEFHHVEYEGKVNQDENIQIIEGLLGKIIGDLLNNNESDLATFLSSEKLKDLEREIQQPFPRLTLEESLNMLYKDTGKDKYTNFTLQNFGSWEEVRLTEIAGGFVAVTEMPLLEVPFYHASLDRKEPLVADNADIIWPGYRETVGSGHRVRSEQELAEKAEIFNLPKEDYAPYLQSRQFEDYEETSGFGMGWERLIQGLLEMPFIYSAPLFPRGHLSLKP